MRLAVPDAALPPLRVPARRSPPTRLFLEASTPDRCRRSPGAARPNHGPGARPLLSRQWRVHADEWPTDADLVRRLLRAQFPRWADLSIGRVPSSGTDNALYRLGDDLLVRLPRRPGAATQADKDQEWLPRLAPHLPVSI